MINEKNMSRSYLLEDVATIVYLMDRHLILRVHYDSIEVVLWEEEGHFALCMGLSWIRYGQSLNPSYTFVFCEISI